MIKTLDKRSETNCPKIIHQKERLSQNEKTLALAINDYFTKHVIEARNKRMALRAMNLLKENPNKSFFFAFGAFHFIGNNTVLDFLQSAGYNITQVGPNDKLRQIKSKSKDNFFVSIPPNPKTISKTILLFRSLNVTQIEKGNGPKVGSKIKPKSNNNLKGTKIGPNDNLDDTETGLSEKRNATKVGPIQNPNGTEIGQSEKLKVTQIEQKHNQSCDHKTTTLNAVLFCVLFIKIIIH